MFRVFQSPRFHRSLVVDAILLVCAFAVGTEVLGWSPSISLRAALAPLCILGNASRYLVYVFTATVRANLMLQTGLSLVCVAAVGLMAWTAIRLGPERSLLVFIGVCVFGAGALIVSATVRKVQLPARARL